VSREQENRKLFTRLALVAIGMFGSATRWCRSTTRSAPLGREQHGSARVRPEHADRSVEKRTIELDSNTHHMAGASGRWSPMSRCTRAS